MTLEMKRFYRPAEPLHCETNDFTVSYVWLYFEMLDFFGLLFFFFQEKQKEKNYFVIFWKPEICDEKIDTKVDYFHRKAPRCMQT